ncbi:MAG: hypothetical protein SPL99_07400 [Catonella sp.]|jgi:hypothetical protein|nr:hypothetical protein [Catonella sp.]MDY6356566.1 hypothetical protein [Catonella sp.]
MEYTSAEASKLLKKLIDEKQNIQSMEGKTATFKAALGEDPESVRPEYNFRQSEDSLETVMRKILKVKHAINVFNSTTEVGDSGMTIDQVLVYLPELNARKQVLYNMASLLPKERVAARFMGANNLIDYRYANFDIDEVKKEYIRVRDEVMALQTALDLVNSTVKFEIDVD